jgi:hypothetical protein
MYMYPLLKNGPSATGAECFLQAGIRGIIYQQQVHSLVNIPGIEELFFQRF